MSENVKGTITYNDLNLTGTVAPIKVNLSGEIALDNSVWPVYEGPYEVTPTHSKTIDGTYRMDVYGIDPPSWTGIFKVS